MALTITKVFSTPLRIRYQLDADGDGFGDSKTLAQLIADAKPGPLRAFLQSVADRGLPPDQPTELAWLFAGGALNSQLIDAATTPGKVTAAPVWGISVSATSFFPSVSGTGGTGGRAYWDLALIHTING